MEEKPMNYHEFKEILQKRIRSEYAEADIYIETVGKNNGIRKERLVIRGKKHELILIPVFMGEDVDSLKEIVQRVNQTNLIPEERLSDSVYYFNPESGEVELAEEEFRES